MIDHKSRKIIRSLPYLPQRQDSLYDQLGDLIWIADRLGFYDAADFLRRIRESV